MTKKDKLKSNISPNCMKHYYVEGISTVTENDRLTPYCYLLFLYTLGVLFHPRELALTGLDNADNDPKQP